MRRPAWPLLLLAVVLTSCSSSGGGGPATFPTASQPSRTSTSPGATTSSGASAPTSPPPKTETIATGLPVPWGMAFLPDGTALVTLRDRGEVLHISAGRQPVSVGHVPGVAPDGEGGLLGIAVSPSFASNRNVFVYLTSARDNRVLRMTFDGTALKADRVIVDGIAKASIHDGGRLAFGPDRQLYISTGDAGERDPAQDKASLNGKILRVTADGAPAPGNPFPGSRVWTLGHRNVQGMAWDKAGVMYASELGQNTWDELNHIQPGRNYGWPGLEGVSSRPGFVDPIAQWPTSDASPSGIAMGVDGAVYMAALRGESLWRIPVEKGKAGPPKRFFGGTYGRLRAVVSAPDGRLWLVTNNTSRGNPKPGDDRIMALRLPL